MRNMTESWSYLTEHWLWLYNWWDQYLNGWNSRVCAAVRWVQIFLFFISTSRYCCVALLMGSSSTFEAEPTGDMRAEAMSSSAVAERRRTTGTINTSYILTHRLLLYDKICVTLPGLAHSPLFSSLVMVRSNSLCICNKITGKITLKVLTSANVKWNTHGLKQCICRHKIDRVVVPKQQTWGETKQDMTSMQTLL